MSECCCPEGECTVVITESVEYDLEIRGEYNENLELLNIYIGGVHVGQLPMTKEESECESFSLALQELVNLTLAYGLSHGNSLGLHGFELE